MWVSRFSIPFDSSRQNVPVYLDLLLHAPDEFTTVRTCGNEPRHCFAVFGYEDSLGLKIFQDRQTLLFEFGSIYLLHAAFVELDINTVKSQIVSIIWAVGKVQLVPTSTGPAPPAALPDSNTVPADSLWNRSPVAPCRTTASPACW